MYDKAGLNGLMWRVSEFYDNLTVVTFLWAPAQRKQANMLYFANVFFYLFFYGRLILRLWCTEVCESFTRGGR